MKKILCVVVAVMLVFAIAPAAFANISVTLDGSAISFDVPPQIVDNRTMVPLRAIFEALGAEIEWDGDTQTVVATRGNTLVMMQVGNPFIIVGDCCDAETIELDVPPLIIDNRTLVPARAVAESFGVDVYWDQAAQTVVLTTGAVGYTPAPYVPAATGLVGEWNWLGSLYYTFRADGTGIMVGSDILWTSSNGVLYICITPALCGSMGDCILPMEWSYTLSGNEMVLNSSTGMSFTYTRR